MKNILLFISLIIIIAFSCKKDEVFKSVDVGTNYFPIDTGSWIEYQVDSIVWNDFYPVEDPRHLDTFNFKIREVNESYFVDNEGRSAIRIERYKKKNDSTDWYLKDVWFANKTDKYAEKVEENERFIKLVFPVKEGVTWNGNAYNTWGNWDYEYQNVNEKLSVNGLSFDSTLVVLQNDQLNLISKIYSIEKYAKKIGLIYKEYINVETNPADLTIKKGVKYKMQITAWGH
ncbi:MAG: hypothetical protein WCK02_15470 [Bacteroidota bacterium]